MLLEFGQCGPPASPQHGDVMLPVFSPSEEQMQHFWKEGKMK